MSTRAKPTTARNVGFTIVELLIVIVVIAILAAIVIVAYNGVQVRALNAAKNDELVAYQKLFEVYKAENGNYPNMPNGGYCLGTGFDDSDGDNVGDCFDPWYAPHAYDESPTLMNMLTTAGGPISTGPRSYVDGLIGPFVEYTNTTISLAEIVQGSDASQCPPPTVYSWGRNGIMLECVIELQR